MHQIGKNIYYIFVNIILLCLGSATCAPNFVEFGTQEHNLHTHLLSGALEKY